MKSKPFFFRVTIFIALVPILLYGFLFVIDIIHIIEYRTVVKIKLSTQDVYFVEDGDVIFITNKRRLFYTLDTMSCYEQNRLSSFYYKVKNDSLFVYGGFWMNSTNRNIVKNVKFSDVGYASKSNSEYEKMGLKVFP